MPSLLSIDFRVRQYILQHVVLTEEAFEPYYPHCSSLAKEKDVLYENNELQIMQVNRQLRFEASQALYGGGRFFFRNPRLALWWISHIGTVNRANLQDVGLQLSNEVMSMADQMDEALWVRVIHQIRTRLRLSCLYLDFEYWVDDSDRFYLSQKSSVVARRVALRKAFVIELSKCRGLRLEVIRNNIMNYREIDSLIYQVSLPPGQEYYGAPYYSEFRMRLNRRYMVDTTYNERSNVDVISVDSAAENHFEDILLEPLLRTRSGVEVVDLSNMEVSPPATFHKSNRTNSKAARLSLDELHQNERADEQNNEEVHEFEVDPNEIGRGHSRLVQYSRKKSLRDARRKAPCTNRRRLLLEGSQHTVTRAVRFDVDSDRGNRFESLAELLAPQGDDEELSSYPNFS